MAKFNSSATYCGVLKNGTYLLIFEFFALRFSKHSIQVHIFGSQTVSGSTAIASSLLILEKLQMFFRSRIPFISILFQPNIKSI
jgi:hypothetical protein